MTFLLVLFDMHLAQEPPKSAEKHPICIAMILNPDSLAMYNSDCILINSYRVPRMAHQHLHDQQAVAVVHSPCK